MAHTLNPTDATPQRTLDEMITLLQDEFAVCHADRNLGEDQIADMIAHWMKMKHQRESWNKPGDTSKLDSLIEHWSALRGNAAVVVVSDGAADEDRCLRFNLVPGEEILIGYANAKHQELSAPLAKRVAKTLGYSGSFP